MAINPAVYTLVAASSVELAVFGLAGLAIFRRWGYTLAESASYTLISVMMILSFLFQVSFLLKRPWLSLVTEALLFLGGSIFIIRNSNYLARVKKRIENLVPRHPVLAVILTLTTIALAASALLLPPDSLHWGQLTRVLLFERSGSFWTGSGGLGGEGLYPVNQMILCHYFLRFNCDLGSGLFSFLAYLSIGCSTYSLARRFSWPQTAFMVTLVVISMPRLVFLANSCGIEAIQAAVSLFCLLAAFRAVEFPNIRDLFFLILGLFFSISGQALVFLFPAVLAGLCGVLLFRRHGLVTWRALVWNNKGIVLAALPGAVIFSQTWLFLTNFIWYGHPIPTPDPSIFQLNPDALIGGLANCGRYLFQSAHFTWPVDLLCHWAVHFSPRDVLEGIYNVSVKAMFGQRGAAVPFGLEWVSNESLSWFGPLAFLLILPALVYALVRGNRRLKAISLALFGYVYLVCVLAAWLPGNARYFTVFFVCGGLVTGFFLPPWRFTRKDMRRLGTICVLLLFFGVLGNSRRLLINPARLFQWGVKGRIEGQDLMAADWGGDVFSQAAGIFRDQRVARFAALVDPGSKVGVMAGDLKPLYPYLLANDRVVFVLLPNRPPGAADFPEKKSLDYLLYVGAEPGIKAETASLTRVWGAPDDSAYQGALFKIRKNRPAGSEFR